MATFPPERLPERLLEPEVDGGQLFSDVAEAELTVAVVTPMVDRKSSIDATTSPVGNWTDVAEEPTPNEQPEPRNISSGPDSATADSDIPARNLARFTAAGLYGCDVS